MILADTIEKSLKTIEAMLGDKCFVWDNTQYSCHVGSLNESAELVAGGFAVSQNKLLIVRKSSFAEKVYPVEKTDFVFFNGKKYLIEAVIEDATETFLQLVLGPTNKRK